MLLKTATNYSIPELKLLGLCVHINQFKHSLAKVNSDCTVYSLEAMFFQFFFLGS